jgi:hypothetical protein
VLNVLKKLSLVPVVAAVLGATGCALQVRTDANAALVHACHSFDWAGSFQGNSSLRTTIANPLNESRLRTAIAARLNSMGVTQASGNADCLIGYGIGAHNVVVGPGPYALGWGWGWPGPFWGGGVGWYGPDVVREGVIGVDVYDGVSLCGPGPHRREGTRGRETHQRRGTGHIRQVPGVSVARIIHAHMQ